MFTWLFLADDHRLAVVTGLTPMWFDAMLTMLLSFQRTRIIPEATSFL